MVAALGAAHKAGIIHRDFKSDNVMLAPAAARGRPAAGGGHGLRPGARRRCRAAVDRTTFDSRSLVGTLAYMAPEQVQGKQVTAQTDIYALGVIMYEMTTGELPFLPPPGEPALTAVLTRLFEAAPPLRTVLPSIDARWNDVVARCLERDTARRPASADDVVRALSDDASGEALAPPAAARVEHSSAPVASSDLRRRGGRRVVLVAAGMVGLAGVVAVAAAIQRRPARRVAATTSAPRETAPRESAPPPTPPTTPDRPTGDPPRAETARAEAAGTDAPVERAPVARRPSARLRRDQTGAAAARELGSGSPAAPASAVEGDPPKPPKPRHRSADPDDGFIFQ